MKGFYQISIISSTRNLVNLRLEMLLIFFNLIKNWEHSPLNYVQLRDCYHKQSLGNIVYDRNPIKLSNVRHNFSNENLIQTYTQEAKPYSFIT